MKIKKHSSSHSIIENVFFWGTALILFLPIVILPPNFQPSDWSRVHLFVIIMTLLLAFLAYRFFYKKDVSFEVPKRGLPFYLPIALFLGYFGIIILTTFTSVDMRFSIFGSPERSEGVLYILSFILFMFFLLVTIKKEQWEKLFIVNFVMGFLASALAIIQFFGLFKNVFLGFETGATPSFLGNSTFLAIYMMFLVFSCLTFFISKRNMHEKIIYGGLLAMFTFTLLATGSRASWIGLLIAGAFYVLSYSSKLADTHHTLLKFINGKRLNIFKIISFIGIGVIVLGLIYVNTSPKLPRFIEDNSQLSHFFHDRLSVKVALKDLLGTRLSVWKITWQAIKEKPITGWGMENFYVGFEKYFDPTMPPSLQRLWWDKPHNIFIEILVNTGFFALFFYLAFWVALFWQLQKLKKRCNENLADPQNVSTSQSAHAMQAMFIGYLIILIFNFNSFSTHLISFFFFAYSLYLISTHLEKIEINPPTRHIPFLKTIGAGAAAAVLLFVFFWNIKPIWFNEKIVYADNLARAKQCQKAFQVINSSEWEKSGITAAHSILKYANTVKLCAFTLPDKEVELSKKTLSLLEVSAEIQPHFTRTWLFMGSYANVVAARETDPAKQAEWVNKAESYLNRAHQTSPKRQEVLIETAKNYLIRNDYQKIKDIANECIAIDPSIGSCYWYLGIAEIFMGDQANGKKHIQEAKDKNYSDPPWLQLAIAYVNQKNYKDAAEAYEMLTAIYPQNPSYVAVLSLLYKELGLYEKAALTARNVFRLQPENPETLQFLQMLLGIKSNSVSIHEVIADIYKEQKDEAKYLQEMRTIANLYLGLIAQQPKNSSLYFHLTKTYIALGEFERALTTATSCLQLDKNIAKDLNQLLNLIPNISPFGERRGELIAETEKYF